MSAKSALHNYLTKQAKKQQREQMKAQGLIAPNKAPEQEVVRRILWWSKQKGWDLDVVESKAVYNESAGRYLTGQARKGFPDIVGNTAQGRAVFIEAKAPGKRYTLRHAQREILVKKIWRGCFAVCVDNIDDLSAYWTAFETLIKAMEHNKAKKYLLDILPKAKALKDDDSLFDSK